MTERRARIRTACSDAATAERVAAALRPDNTDAIDTRVEDEAVVTTVRREATGGLATTVDDYLVNYAVAARLAETHDNHE